MPVYGTTKAIELLQKRQSLDLQLQRSTRENYHRFSKQRDNVLEPVLELQSRLIGEFQRQTRLHELKKRERYTGWFPPLSKQTVEQKTPRAISTFTANIMHFKPIKKRVSSAGGTDPKVVCNRRYDMENSELCRHFCELLGPNLCVDCMKLRERLDALRDNEEPPAPLHLERDPFTALVFSHYSKECENDDSDEEVNVSELSDQEDLDYDAEIQRKQSPVSKVYFSPSPPGRGDSGYSSRVSYIKDLTRPQSCGSLLRSLSATPSIPLRREKTYGARMRNRRTQNNSRNNSGLRSTLEDESPDSHGFTETLEKLQKRKENLGFDGRWPERKKGPLLSWQKTPVEPILMELKLINFTQYDKLGYGPPAPEPEPPEPVIPTDEFGFPIMANTQISSL